MLKKFKRMSLGLLASSSLLIVACSANGKPITDDENKLWVDLNKKEVKDFLVQLWQEKVIKNQYQKLGKTLNNNIFIDAKFLKNEKDKDGNDIIDPKTNKAKQKTINLGTKIIDDLKFIRLPEVKKIALFIIAKEIKSNNDYLINKASNIINSITNKNQQKYNYKNLRDAGFIEYLYHNDLNDYENVKKSLGYEIEDPEKSGTKITGLEILYRENQEFKLKVYKHIIATNFLLSTSLENWAGVFEDEYKNISSFYKNNILNEENKGFLLTKYSLDNKLSFQWEIALQDSENDKNPNDFFINKKIDSFVNGNDQFKDEGETRLAHHIKYKEKKKIFSDEIFNFKNLNLATKNDIFSNNFLGYKGIKKLEIGEGNLNFNFGNEWIKNLGLLNKNGTSSKENSFKKWYGFLNKKGDLYNEYNIDTENKEIDFFAKKEKNAKLTRIVAILPYKNKDGKLNFDDSVWNNNKLDIALNIYELNQNIYENARKFYTTDVKEKKIDSKTTTPAKPAIWLDVKNEAYRDLLKSQGYLFFKKYN